VGATPIALLISPFYVTLTCPDPPMMEPYMVSIKKKVETTISAIRDGIVILAVPK